MDSTALYPTPAPARALDDCVQAQRAAIYRWLADALRYPGAESEACARRIPEPDAFTELPGVTGERAAELAAAAGEATAALAALPPGEMESEYVTIFGHTIPKEYPPYETEFTAGEVFRQTAELGDISGFYNAFGMRVSRSAAERADAIHIELEFMYLLVVKEALARREGLEEPAAVCRSAQERFLLDHLGRWGVSLGLRMVEKTGSRLYSALGRLLAAWLRAEFLTLGMGEPIPVGAPVASHFDLPSDDGAACVGEDTDEP
ncbi:MAG: molecular chaperone TorD family protein [Planctomycetes bacterium]|nr:molecular chaperone TorD family protein [Planctomycetota bacterium]